MSEDKQKIKLIEAAQYTLQILTSEKKYVNNDELWSCITHLLNALVVNLTTKE